MSINNNQLITDAFVKIASQFQIVRFSSDRHAIKTENYLQTCDYSFVVRSGYNEFILDLDYHAKLKSLKLKAGLVLQDIELSSLSVNFINFVAKEFKK